MDQISQWFLAAAGFSGEDLSEFIRSFTLFIAVIWAAFIARGMIGEMHNSDEPMGVFGKLIMLLMFIAALWIVMY